MSDEDVKYEEFMASDDDGNYDFMMSDEEDMAMIEMEEETDEDDNDKEADSDKLRELKPNEIDIDTLENLYELALSFEEDQDFNKARELFSKIYCIPADSSRQSLSIRWRWKAIAQLLKCWASEIHYNGVCEGIEEKVLDDFRTLASFLKQSHRDIDINYLKKTLIELLDELFPSLSRGFLFAIELIDQSSLALRMRLRLRCIQELEKSIFEEAPWDKEVQKCVEFKRIAAEIWNDRLQSGTIDMTDLRAMEQYCDGLSPAEAEEDRHCIDNISLILQCQICRFMEASGKVSKSMLLKYVTKLEQLTSNSLSISQHLGLMIQLHLAKAIILLLDDVEEEHSTELPIFFDNVTNLREQFWGCLQHVEEIGGHRQQFSSLFERFILSGFIFCNMVLYRAEKDKINPFDFEQIKVAQDAPCVQKLQTVYHHFINLNLPELYASIQELSEVKDLLAGLIETIYYLAQIAKLWTKIAPVYSCISLKDIQEMLKIDESIEVSRDDLLTVLMKSIMKDNADVFYKLDLTKDLVYFGAEHKVQLCMLPKESFTLATEQKESVSGNGVAAAKITDLEFANNVGIFDEPCRLRDLDSGAFFDKLQSSRESIRTASKPTSNLNVGFQPQNMRYSNKYGDLAELATEILSHQHQRDLKK